MPVVRALGYRRVSTNEQAEHGGGLDAQGDAIERWCAYKHYELLEVVTEAKSTTKARPKLLAVFNRLDAGEASVLVVAKLDRMARSAGETERVLDRARKKGWVLVPLDIGVDTTTPMGEAFAATVAVFARLERRRIGERTKEGMDAKRAAGTFKAPPGRPPAVPVEVRARIRRERVDEGKSLQAIADGLMADGVVTGHGGARWHKSTVKALLAGQAD